MYVCKYRCMFIMEEKISTWNKREKNPRDFLHTYIEFQ